MSLGASLPVRTGDIIAGKYKVDRVLGAGAMGVVVAAMHLDLHELRALKLMLPSALTDAEAVERFLREARAAARLKSDHVAKIYDVDRLETGFPYIVLELLEGTDLKSLLEREGVLSVERAARYVAQACDAVGEAHTHGIIHRDLKPANLFLTRGPRGEERVKVLDFGIAKMADPAGAVDVTRTATVLGTPLYMSPEQMRGAKYANVRSDVWSLGVILYHMCTGRVPFAGSTITEVCSAVISDLPEAPRTLRADISPEFEALILRCLEKSPVRRFEDARELGAALAPFASGSPIVAMPAAGGSTVIMSPPAAGAAAAGAPPVVEPPAPPPFGSPAVPPPAPPGSSTTQSTAWAQSGASPAAGLPPANAGAASTKPTSRVPFAIAAIAVLAIFLGGAGWTASRFLLSAPAAQPPSSFLEPTSTEVTIATVGPTAEPTSAEPAAPASASAIPVATTTAALPAAKTTTAPPPVKPAPSTTATSTAPVKPSGEAKKCDPPYVIDSAGRRHMKPECL